VVGRVIGMYPLQRYQRSASLPMDHQGFKEHTVSAAKVALSDDGTLPDIVYMSRKKHKRRHIFYISWQVFDIIKK